MQAAGAAVTRSSKSFARCIDCPVSINCASKILVDSESQKRTNVPGDNFSKHLRFCLEYKRLVKSMGKEDADLYVWNEWEKKVRLHRDGYRRKMSTTARSISYFPPPKKKARFSLGVGSQTSPPSPSGGSSDSVSTLRGGVYGSEKREEDRKAG